ncbi:PAS domain-containing protein, partial [Anaplasma marginale]|uniref:PAS domain-containing protein n=1 Tax=Anaplasma marginale TaxID=770 RepID=UPI0005B48A65
MFKNEIDHYKNELRFIHKNGNIVILLIYGTLIRNSFNEPDYLIAHFIDITEQKLIETQLIQSHERYQTIVGTIHDSIIITNDEHEILYKNPSTDNLTRNNQQLLDEIVELNRSDGLSDLKVVTKEGKKIYLEVQVKTIDWENQKANLITLHDLTYRTEIEHALKASENRFRMLINLSPSG